MKTRWMLAAAMLLTAGPSWCDALMPYKVRSYTVVGRGGNPVTFRVVTNNTQKSNGRATYSDNVIHMNWARLQRNNASPQFIQFVLAHEAGHLVKRDRGVGSESTADFFAGRMLRLAGFTAADMAVLQRDMLRLYKGGGVKHPANSQRVMVMLRGYNSAAARTAPLVSETLVKFGKQVALK